jgi:hypothetical protein
LKVVTKRQKNQGNRLEKRKKSHIPPQKAQKNFENRSKTGPKNKKKPKTALKTK